VIMANKGFTEDQVQRYSRHILLPEVSVEGQQKLLNSSVLVLGAGGLGSPALLYLAAAGIGRIGVIDFDHVELSNLQRQVIHDTDDLGRNKATSAKETIGRINPDCTVDALPERLSIDGIADLVRNYDVVLDGSDNFPTRFLLSDCCWFERIPLISAAVLRFEGQLMTILPGDGNPCYRCWVPEPPPADLVPSCQVAGVLGAVVGVMGTLQATETLKLLLGIGETMSDRLLIYDALRGSFQKIKRRRDPSCPLCGDEPTITELAQRATSCCAGGECCREQ